MKNPWVIVAIITVVLFGGAIWYSSTANEKSNEGVSAIEHIKGNPQATVTLVEYSDFQCPACAAFQPVLKELMDTYGDKIRFEYKHYPLPIHSYAQQAALAAEAAGQQGKFYEYHDLLFMNQQAWSSSKTPNVLFLQYANDLGLDIEKFKMHMKSSVLRDVVKNSQEAGRELGITGTPTFYINGEKMEIETFEGFVSQVVAVADPAAAAALTASSTQTTTETPAVKFGI